MSASDGKGVGTPPPHFLQTNTGGAQRRRGGQPGNRNAVSHGRRTAEMRALRADVRMAVQKAKALTAMAWASPVGGAITKRDTPH